MQPVDFTPDWGCVGIQHQSRVATTVLNSSDIHYSQSCILTPCDFAFARDGVAADTTPNVEAIAFADINLQSLILARQKGTVRNLLDRRHELYDVVWHGH